MQMPVLITMVRTTPDEGRRLLQAFVFGGKYAGRRPPRGIDPALVPEFAVENLKPDSAPASFMRMLDTALFYEAAGILPHIRTMLLGTEKDSISVQRSAWRLQMFGELGSQEEVVQAARYFDGVLVPSEGAGPNLQLLLETLPTLAPAGSIDRLYQRMGAEIQVASQTKDPDDPENIKLEKLRDLMGGPAPIAVTLLQARTRLMSQAPDQRRMELTGIYLGQSSLSDRQTQIWAARLLRKEAMQLDAAPVRAVFARALDAADPSRMDPVRADFIAHRAAQAILYFQGKLTPAQRARYEKVKTGPENFLWDDMEPPPIPGARDED